MKFFCTGGKGTEKFIIEEVKSKLDAKNVSDRTGKVIFESDTAEKDPSQLLHLKSVERIFLCLFHLSLEEFLTFKNMNLPALKTIQAVLRDVPDWNVFHQAYLNSQTSPACSEEDVSSEPPTKIAKLETSDDNERSYLKPCAFRMSCKCSGRISRGLNEKILMQSLGRVVSERSGWQVNLRNPDVEVFLQLNNDGLICGIPLTRRPLSNRSYIRNIGLRSPIAYIMTHLLHIQSGDIILDPMCGAGTILVEAAKLNQDVVCVGIDTDESQLMKAHLNVKSAQLENRVQFLHGNVQSLPMRSSIADGVVCDIPFGKNHGEIEALKKLYPHMLLTMNRVLKPGGRCVLLTGVMLKRHVIELATKPFVICAQNKSAITSPTSQPMDKARSSDVNADGNHGEKAVDGSAHAQSIQSSDSSVVEADTSASRKEPNATEKTHEGTAAATDAGQNEDKEDNPESSLRESGATGCDTETDTNAPLMCSATDSTSKPEESTPQNCTCTCVNWRLLGEHYVKLGETDAYICEFVNENDHDVGDIK